MQKQKRRSLIESLRVLWFADWKWDRLVSLLGLDRNFSPKSRIRTSRQFEQLETRAMMTTTLGLGDIVFTGYQATAPDKVSFVLMKDVTAGTTITITDNAWTGSSLGTSEGNSVITLGANFTAGTQFNYDGTRGTSSRWAVGTTTTNVSDATGSNFSLNASGDNIFAYNGSTPPSSGSSASWIAALASNPFLTSGNSTASLTFLPSVFDATTSLSLGLANGAANENGAYTSGSLTGNANSVRASINNLTHWTTFTTAAGQSIPPNAIFNITSNTNSAPTGLSISNTVISENNAIGASIGTLTTTDPDLGDTFTYALVSGTGSTDNASFKISGNTLQANQSFNYESKNSYSIRLRTTDLGGLFFEQQFTISVSDVNEATGVRINELKINPPGNGADNNKYQYVELIGDPGTLLTNVYLMSFDGSGSNVGTSNYLLSLNGYSLGSNGLLVIKSPTAGHVMPSSTTIVTDPRIDQAGGAFSKTAVSFYLAYAPAAPTLGSDYDADNNGVLDGLPVGFSSIDNVGWVDGDTGGVVYGGVALTQNAGTPDAATRATGDSRISALAWYNGDLNDVANDPAQLLYDSSRHSNNLPLAPDVASLTPGDVNFTEPPLITINIGTSVTVGTSGNIIKDTSLRTTDAEQSASQLTYTVTSLPAAGVLKFSGSPVVANSTTFTQADITANKLTYDAPTSLGTQSFSFTVSDGTHSTGSTFALTAHAAVDNTLRIVSYNIASSGGNGSPRTGLDTLLQAFSNEVYNSVRELVDLFIFQEVQSQSTTSQFIVNQLNAVYGSGKYARGTLDGYTSGAGTQGVVYNTETLQLLNEATVGPSGGASRQTLRYKFHPIGSLGTSDFYVYNSHLKASDQPSDAAQRASEAIIIRADADLLASDANIIYAGDFNVYNSSEASFQTFVGAGNGQAVDPINRLGAWHNNASFKEIFTQAPAVSPPPGLTSGGLDDRFDFQLNSTELTDGSGLEYLPGSYHVFGNNGSVALNGNINDSSSTALLGLANRITLLNLLTTVTDHLPVVVDYRFAATNNSPPTILAQTLSIAENSANNTVVGSIVATDPDLGDVLSYSISGGNSLGAFKISTSGVLTVADSSKLDFEATQAFNLTVKVTDTSGAVASNTITVQLTNVAEAPTIAPQSFTAPENSANGTAIGTVVVSTDSVATVASFAITAGNGTGIFAIDSSGNLIVTGQAQLDYETIAGHKFDLTVQVTDSVGLSASGAITINVSDVNEAVVLGLGDLVFTGYQATTTDKLSFVLLKEVDSGTTLTITDNAWTGAALTTNEGTSILTFGGTFSSGTVFNFDASRASGQKWGVGTTTIGLSDVTSGGFSLNASGDNLFAYNGSSPPASELDAAWISAFATNNFVSAGSQTSNLTALPGVYAVGNTALSLRLANGASNENGVQSSPSSVYGSAAQIRTIVNTVGNWTTFTLADGQAIPPDITYTVDNVPTDISITGTSIEENSSPASLIGTLSSVDLDLDDTFTYSLVAGSGSIDNGLFSINGNELYATESFNFESKQSYSIRIRTTDQAGASFEKVFSISVLDVNEPPTIEAQGFSIAENSPNLSVVGTVIATDVDAGDSLTFEITGGNSAEAFAISQSGIITVADETLLDFETNSNFSLTVNVTDLDGHSASATVSIAITNVNERPSIVGQSFTNAENLPNGTTIGTIVGSDEDSGDSIVYAIVGGSNRNAISIQPTTGVITVANSTLLNFESEGSTFSVIVRATDSGNLSAEAEVTIHLTDVNDPPVILPQSFTINNKSTTNAPVGKVLAFDADLGQTLTYSIVAGNEGGAFKIDASTGHIQVADSSKLPSIPKGSTSVDRTLTVAATDTESATNSAAITITVSTTGLNAPMVSDSILSIAENNKKTDGSTKVGVIKPIASYAGQKFGSYLLSGADAGKFGIDSNGNIRLASGVSLNYETQSVYRFDVTVADSKESTKATTAAVTVNVINVNEAPVYQLKNGVGNDVPILGGKASLQLDESIPTNSTKNGYVIAVLTAVDQDQVSSSLKYQKDSKGQDVVLDKTGAFAYNANTGEIYVFDEEKVSYESNKSIKLSFSVADDAVPGDAKGTVLSTKLTVTVNLNDLNEVPAFDAKSPTVLTVAENNKAGVVVGQVKAKDADTKAVVKQVLTYTIESIKDEHGVDSAVFSIDSATGKIFVAAAGAIDYELSASYTIVVRVTDNGSNPGLFAEQTITVNVVDVNEASTFELRNSSDVIATSLTVSKGSAVDNVTVIGKLKISDPDHGSAGIYSPGLIAGAVVAASRGALTYDESSGNIVVLNKSKLTKTFTLSLSLKDSSSKPLTSKFSFVVNVN